MKKFKRFDITFVCKDGKYELNGCTKIPTKKEFEDCVEDIVGLIGAVKSIVINKIETE